MQKTKVGAVFLVLGIAAVFFSILSALPPMADEMEAREQTSLLSGGWYYLKDGERVSVELPAILETDGKETLVLYNDSLTQREAGMTLTTRSAQYGIRVSMDDQILYG